MLSFDKIFGFLYCKKEEVVTNENGKELIIPAFSEESYQFARQRANDCHNFGTFAFMVIARKYESVNDFIDKARVADKKLLERAPCQGIVLDPVVGETDFFENTKETFRLIARNVTLQCFLVRHSHFTKYSTIIARNTDELDIIKRRYWEIHGVGQPMIQVLSSPPEITRTLHDELNRDSNVIIYADVMASFENFWSDSIYKKFNNAIIIF